MPNAGTQPIDENEIKWNLDFFNIVTSGYTVSRNPKAKMIKYAIDISRNIILKEMRTYDTSLFNTTANNILQTIISDFRDNRDYLDIREFMLNIYYNRIKYDEITQEQIDRFCKVFYSRLAEEAEKVRMKTEIWDYEDNGAPKEWELEDEEEEGSPNLFDTYLEDAITGEQTEIPESENQLPEDVIDNRATEEDLINTEEDIKAIEEAVPDESVATVIVDGTIHEDDDNDDD